MKIPLSNTSNLDIYIFHRKGEYNLYVYKEKPRIVDGVEFVEYCPFDEGNFCFTLLEGRKSGKKLEKMNAILSSKKDFLLDFWQNKKYKVLCQYVFDLVKDL